MQRKTMAITVAALLAFMLIFGCPLPPSPEKTQSTYEDSPFGVFAAYAHFEYTYFNQKMGFSDADCMDWADEHMKDLGAHWTRSNLQLMWDKVESEIGKGYNWDNDMKTDELVKRIYASSGEINWLGVFHEQSGDTQGDRHQAKPQLRNPVDYPDEYKAFVKAAVERYDGDGVDDASPNVHVKYWQAGNETMGWTSSGRTTEDYMDYVRMIKAATKEADPESKVVLIAAMDGKNIDPFLKEVIKGLAAEKAFDVVDIHFWGPAPNWKMSAVKEYRALLDSLGLNDVQIWSCEHGTWVGQPEESPGIQTESDQASSLVKRYAYDIANGLDRLMWNNIIEWQNFGGNSGSMFNSMGLIGDGQGNGEDTAMFNVPRLSYYSYKLMTQKLEGSDWKSTEIVQESGNIYAYKFVKKETGKVVWVAWWEDGQDTGEEKTISINVGSLAEVAVTKAVPSFTSGKYVTSFDSAFEFMKVKAVNGSVSVTLVPGEGPVYIEDSSDAGIVGNEADSLAGAADYDRAAWKGGNIAGGNNGAGTGGATGQDCLPRCMDANKNLQICQQVCGVSGQLPGGGTGAGAGTGTGGAGSKLCGDGTCDEIERTNNICPEDCGTGTGTGTGGETLPVTPSCGDGVCGPREKSGEISCPADCS